MLKKVQNYNETEEFGKYKMDLIKEHQYYANKLGLYDMVVDKYNINDALRHIGQKNYYQFLIMHDNQSIGMVEYKIEKSEIDNRDILYLKDIYIKKEFRGIGFGRKVFNELKKLKYRIELECWYSMPANNFYKLIKYDFNTEYNYNSENKLSKVTDDLKLSQAKVAGVYQKIIEYDENEYSDILEKLNFKTNQEMPKVDFEKQSVVVTVSRYEIKEIKKNIGNIKYELGKFLDEYVVNIFIVSKVVNINCIYFNNNSDEINVSTFSINDQEDGADYYVQDGKYYTNINGKKTEIISIEGASDIAETEAKKEKYQYQSWKSEFYSRENQNDSISGELILGLDDISRFAHWRAEWQNEEYEDKIMWKIRLFDKNDPLTSLYVYNYFTI